MPGVFENQGQQGCSSGNKGERESEEAGEVGRGPDWAGLVCCSRTLNFISGMIGGSGGQSWKRSGM